MSALPGVARFLLLAVFIVASVLFTQNCVAPGRAWIGRLNDGAHIVMGVIMTLTLMIGDLADPGGIQVAVFAIACAWFLVQASGVPLSAAALRPAWDDSPQRTVVRIGSSRRWEHVHHAVLMAAMVWMLYGSTAPSDQRAMAGMAMPTTSAVPQRSLVVAAAVYCLVTAPLWGAIVGRRRPRADSRATRLGRGLAHAMMTAGMGVMLLSGH